MPRHGMILQDFCANSTVFGTGVMHRVARGTEDDIGVRV
jgi:hypothetical protein